MVRKPYKKSIRYKFLKEIFLILFVGTILLSTVIAINEGKILRRSLVTKGKNFASYIAMLSQEPLIMKDSIQLDSIVSQANKDEDIMYIAIYDAQGNLVTSQYASINYRSPRLKVILAGLSKKNEVEDIIAAIRNKEVITELSVPILTGTYTIGKVTICMSRYNIHQQIVKTVLFVLVLNVMVAIVLAAVVFIVSRQIIFDPITELAHAIARLAKGDLSTRIAVKATGEVQMLLEGFNQMAEDLDKTTVSKDYVDNIIKSMINSLIVVSPDNKIIRTNMATCMLLGYEEKELVGRPVETIFGGSRSGKDPWMKTMLKDNHVSNIEETYLTKNGREIPVLLSASVMYDASKVIRGIVYVAQDITERKQAEEALRESENKYRKIFENVQDAFYQTDNAGNITDISPSIERYSGYPREELIGKSVGEVYFNPEDRIRLLKAIQEKGEVVDYELRLKSKDNRLIYASANAHVLFDLAGKPIGVEGTLRDITERKRAEEELQKLAAVVRYSSELINLTTLDGKMVFLNEAGAKMLGISPEEIEQTNIMQIIPDHLKEKVQNELMPALMNHGTWEGDLQYLNLKTGQLTDVHTMSFMIKDAVTGAPLFLANVSLDITEQKELEAALHQAKEEAERANRAKTIFLANMSHEIRTPMNAILGFSQLMQRDPTVTPRQRQQLDTINRSGEHLLALINDILEISKIEAGRVTLNPTAFDLHALLNDLEMMFRLRTDAKNLQFSVECVGEVPRFVVSDEGKLREVLINLLGNAVKFTKKGGIILRVRALHEETKELRLRAEIEDTGPGIAAEDMDRLFHHFEQMQAGRDAGTGTGLGLAISREFVRLMGGDITVSSQVGRGSLFGFNIALKEADPAAVVVKAESRCVTGLQPGQPQYRVLVADDKEDNRELLSQMLGPVGFQIRQVADGEEAVKEFEMWNPNLILMDLRMPVVDGYEAIRRIRASVGGKDARIIAVTASAFEDTRQEVLATGADDFISKPFRETELLEKIGRLLGVKYVYAEESVSVAAKPEALEALTSESLAGLPGELVRQIRESTINADLDRVLELIQQAATHDARAANGLRSLAERFDYQKLLDLLPTGGTTNGTTNES
jgi:PAS domain S-box-containing protein